MFQLGEFYKGHIIKGLIIYKNGNWTRGEFINSNCDIYELHGYGLLYYHEHRMTIDCKNNEGTPQNGKIVAHDWVLETSNCDIIDDFILRGDCKFTSNLINFNTHIGKKYIYTNIDDLIEIYTRGITHTDGTRCTECINLLEMNTFPFLFCKIKGTKCGVILNCCYNCFLYCINEETILKKSWKLQISYKCDCKCCNDD